MENLILVLSSISMFVVLILLKKMKENKKRHMEINGLKGDFGLYKAKINFKKSRTYFSLYKNTQKRPVVFKKEVPENIDFIRRALDEIHDYETKLKGVSKKTSIYELKT